MKPAFRFITTFLFLLPLFSASSQEEPVEGFGILERIRGQWYGPVTSQTPAGNFENWYVDFRPVAANQVSQFSQLDSLTVNNISFFVVKYKEKLSIAMRTEGCFAHKCCVTYEVIDSVNEAFGYYRFADFVAGNSRAFTVFKFSDSTLVMEVFTNRFNKEKSPLLHSQYKAKLTMRDTTNTVIGFPSTAAARDFSSVFSSLSESIYFDRTNDPYSSQEQPGTGSLSVSIATDPSLPVKNQDELCVFLTTKPLFRGIKYLPENFVTLSRYLYMPGNTKKCTLSNVHPGKYYVYAFNDRNGDKRHKSGDYMTSDTGMTVVIESGKQSEIKLMLDFVIP